MQPSPETTIQLPEGVCRGERERRAMCQALDYWRGLGGTDSLPRRDTVHPEEQNPELSDNLFVLDLTEPSQPIIEWFGQKVSQFCTGGRAQDLASEVFPRPLGENLPYLCESLVSSGRPIGSSGIAASSAGDVIYRAILLPLSSDGETVDAVLGCVTFKAYG